MHILIIPSWYKTPKEPIKGTFFEEQARMLLAKGHRVGILYTHHDYGFITPYRFDFLEREPKAYIDNNIPTYYSYTFSFIPKNLDINPVDKFLIARKAYRTYKKYVKEHGEPDVLHAHSTIHGGIAAAYISKKARIPYILTEHFSQLIPSGKKPLPDYLVKTVTEVFNGAVKAYVVSSFFRKKITKFYPQIIKPIEVLPNIVNSIFFEKFQSIILSNPIRFVIVANLKEEKNHKLAIAALKLLREREGLDYVLNIVGEGYFRPHIKNFVNSNGVSDHVIFHGAIPREEVKRLIDRAHILLSPSVFETFGINVAEALACGRPVVALDSGGVRDILNSGDAVIVSQNDPELFAAGILQIINTYSDYDQLEMSNRCKARFSEKKVYEVLGVTYREVVSKISNKYARNK